MIYKLYNALKQPLIHKGQLCNGDIVHFTDGGIASNYIVMDLKGSFCTIQHAWDKYRYYDHVEFTEGVGWGWESEGGSRA